MQLIQSLKGGGGSAELHQMHKQQVAYSEAIESLRKKMEYTEKVALENKETLQVNIKLAGELEDYRSQTKRLIHDIQQKDQELIALRRALAQKFSGTNEVGISSPGYQDLPPELSGKDSEDETAKSVQFMWQPLSDLSYPTITLLASFKVSVTHLW